MLTLNLVTMQPDLLRKCKYFTR